MKKRDRVTEVLIRARQRISDKRRWQRMSRATVGPPGHRRAIRPGDPRAERWCAVGAVEAEACTARASHKGWRITLDRDLYDAALLRLEAVASQTGSDVVRTNDRKGHAAVLALFDAAIRQK